MVELSIVMPCLNEARTLAACIQKAQTFLQRSGISGEVLIADNGSTDGSQDIAHQLGARVVRVPIRGYGAACLLGLKAARGKYAILGDADDSYDFSELDAFVAKLRDGFEVVMGDRFAGGIDPGAMPWKNRYVGNPILTFIGKVLFGSGVADFHCGLRGIRCDILERLNLRTPGMEFASEMVAAAEQAGLRIANVPTKLHKDGRDRPPHLRPWRDGWRHLRLMLLLAAAKVLTLPGFVGTALFLAGMLVSFPGPITLGPFRGEIGVLIGCVIGFSCSLQVFLAGIIASVHFNRNTPKIWARLGSLSYSLPAAGALAVTSLVCVILAINYWASFDFGDITTDVHLRLLLAGAAAAVTAVQVFSTSLCIEVSHYMSNQALLHAHAEEAHLPSDQVA